MSQGLNNDIAVSKTRRVVKNLRWWVLVLFLLGVTVNYITRNSLGIIAPELKATLGITTEQYSWIVGAFQLAYDFPAAAVRWLIDVIGLKLGFMICATLWALACIAHAGAGSWLHWLCCASLWVGPRRPLLRPTPKPSANGFRNLNGQSPPAGLALGSPSARCWPRRSSTSPTPPSAGKGRLCLPARWRYCG